MLAAVPAFVTRKICLRNFSIIVITISLIPTDLIVEARSQVGSESTDLKSSARRNGKLRMYLAMLSAKA